MDEGTCLPEHLILCGWFVEPQMHSGQSGCPSRRLTSWWKQSLWIVLLSLLPWDKRERSRESEAKRKAFLLMNEQMRKRPVRTCDVIRLWSCIPCGLPWRSLYFLREIQNEILYCIFRTMCTPLPQNVQAHLHQRVWKIKWLQVRILAWHAGSVLTVTRKLTDRADVQPQTISGSPSDCTFKDSDARQNS